MVKLLLRRSLVGTMLTIQVGLLSSRQSIMWLKDSGSVIHKKVVEITRNKQPYAMTTLFVCNNNDSIHP